MYSIAAYGKMIADELRMRAYSCAMQRAISSESIVLDIGAGTGVFSLLACQYGARKVFAIEPSNAISVAEETVRANRFADRVVCIQGLSTEISLTERADVIVSDLRGVLPLFEQHIPSIIDSRNRLLGQGGTLIPKRDVIWAAIVEEPQLYSSLTEPWSRERFKLSMDSARRIATNQWIKARVRPNQLLSKPSLWTTIDYLTVESPNVSAGITFKVERPGTAHGFVLWFDAVLDDGIEFSNAPGERELIYGSAFFPWDQPVVLGPNDQVFIDLRADLVGSDYVWTWNTRVSESNSVTPKVQFRQSTFFGSPIPIAQLRKRNADHRPQLGEDGKIELKTLELMDGTRSNDEITRILAETFRARFIDPRDALPIVTRLAEKYGR